MKTYAGWWILVQFFTGTTGYGGIDYIPRAVGPYPSQEMCRIAGRALMPTNRDFWTQPERDKAEAEDKEAATKAAITSNKRAAQVATIKQEILAGKRKPGQITLEDSDEQILFDKNGDWHLLSFGTGSSGTIIFSAPEPQALTPCVEIKTAQP